MALNPIVFTEKVVRSFLRYQLTAYPFADERLHAQMRNLLSLDETRDSPLLKGPFISLSRPFRQGAAVADLAAEGLLHPVMRQRIPAEITHVYGHQEDAIRAIRAGRTTLVSTGTGSGKTECFLYPIVSKCLELRDEGAPPGISAVLVYPMNALAEDQLVRLRGLLAATGIPFGMYVGKTPERDADVAGVRLPAGASRADYLAAIDTQKDGHTVYPAEEVCSRELMRTAGRQPRILLTNVKQLELLLTRQKDVELFANARLDFLVFDEAHTFTGAHGAETACLIRRLRAFCGRDARDSVAIATSATIVDRNNPDAARSFASRFFGVAPDAVSTVHEAYEAHVWSAEARMPPAPRKEATAILSDCVAAVEAEGDPGPVRAAYRALAGTDLEDGPWPEALGRALRGNALVRRLSDLLAQPRALGDLPGLVAGDGGRHVSEAEILAWLTLGAAARVDGRPLVRPVVHVFVRGISGAVVSFEPDSADPRLWLAAEDEIASHGGSSGHAHFRVTTCTTCGQHYFIAFLKDFEYTASRPGGGEAAGESAFWEPLEEAQGGKRLVLVDRIVGGSDDDDGLEEHERLTPVHFCRQCGAGHPEAGARCLHCGRTGDLVLLYAVRQKEENPGFLTSCLSCGANGRRIVTTYREPARPVRATNVADVHVLAQDMVHHSERQRLLVFCDNRQDAAFQAGWMRDHARRFRLRALMAGAMKAGSVSIGDVVHAVDEQLERDETLSRALVPEVWQVVRREGGGGRHEQERRKFLRIQVLREVATSARQPIGLEPWGRMRVEYLGLDAGHDWIQRHARALGLPPEDLREGVASVLDYLRRRRALLDREYGIFTKYWMDGDLELQQGYLPQFGSPVGTKLRRNANEKQELVIQWLSARGDTTLRQIARKWGVKPDETADFVESLFRFVVDEQLIVPVRLLGARGRGLPGATGVHQVDADRLRLHRNHGVWRCRSCRRRVSRRTPHQTCPAWRCTGDLEFLREDSDNYDLQVLDQNYTMLRPAEHTAMVPHDERERLENFFKGDSEVVNAFVCTPTLELGVDIGQLDAVLMRNVPPLAANYWQRAGRAGRRHRMAVDVTYCRPVSHDRAYFADPLKLLAGRVDPPAFNLRNDLMVAKHVRAAVITRLQQYTRDSGVGDERRRALEDTLRSCLPAQVSAWLFDGGVVREAPFDFSPLEQLIAANASDLGDYVERAFRDGWPEADADAIAPERLRGYVQGFVADLREVVSRLERRLRWALGQIRRLNVVRERHGALESEDDALFRRCDAVVRRLKGIERRTRREAEGYDDVNTFGVLAAEGFLPGYGLEVGSILGEAEIPYWQTGAMEFVMPRPPSVALREYVPGNLIYANGHRFVARRFHRDVDENRVEVPVFEVSVTRQAVKEGASGAPSATLDGTSLPAIAVCDVDLVHQSHISDDEELRFQLPVAVYGYERDQHNGGRAYRWGEQVVHHRRGVRMRLVNVGAVRAMQRDEVLGYPVCTVCGQSRSSMASERELEHFRESHLKRCGRRPESVGFYADVVADVLSLPACPNRRVAYSVLEALRIAATRVLDMHMDDLQVQVVGHVDRDEVDGLLWDPMPGGSGLLDQICDRFEEIAGIAREVVEQCPGACEASCIDCLQTFRNAFYHAHLDRKEGGERLAAWRPRLLDGHPIPPKQPSQELSDGAQPVNEAERRLRHLLRAAGFNEGERGRQIRLDPAIGTTTPDVVFRASHHDEDEGICVYLDGLSGHLHGNAATPDRDRTIRTWLRNNGWEVIEITASDLFDEDAMVRHLRKLAGYLGSSDLRDRVRQNTSWFGGAARSDSPVAPWSPRVVRPKAEDRYRTCVPILTLQAAAGAFGDPQQPSFDDADWVELEGGRRLRLGMFVAQVVGTSMEPAISDGSHCLFAAPVEGSRQGKTVLVRLRDRHDPDTGERFTVKRYFSEKTVADDGVWRHVKITLKPNNPAFAAIELTAEAEGEVDVVAEVVEVLK
jgi:ATP-dependent helicase YprA (DUF1998 family)/SOS-response transcriptional repressor LexA